MKYQMNFTTSYDDTIRFQSAEELHDFYKKHGCDGLELMPLPYSTAEAPDIYLSPKKCPLIVPGMVTGIHCCCVGDWINQDRKELNPTVKFQNASLVLNQLCPEQEAVQAYW